ncbi:MAG: hypothetical protein A2261_03340 [Candidatus Magasanikbacteria bacterium RIFOXYA2_FULL_44_8]|uniref:Uncharacterized protein n=1 Tax=Candidatus Magasanikbacteria bacterium RIFOXYA2_FULL_44_8 TaxID=1798696 RepID=A0A1F6NIW5_9BACT|nr:MAG: hypothetical protein A2261_03340 [Candidatus Magasanikbacteria bacterium RIFOXYA2_FULL_44_8]
MWSSARSYVKKMFVGHAINNVAEQIRLKETAQEQSFSPVRQMEIYNLKCELIDLRARMGEFAH